MSRFYFFYILTFLLLITISNGSADTIETVFHNFKVAYEKSKNFSANFEETTLRAGNKSTARGRLIFSKPNLLRKEYVSQRDPTQLAQLIVLDGEYSWSYTPLLSQVNKMKWGRSNRKELLPGLGASLDEAAEKFNMELVPDEVANPKGIYRIKLVPKPQIPPNLEANTPREIIEIWVKSDKWLPVQFGYQTENDNEGSISVIVAFANIQRDIEMDADSFKFVIPDGVEVIDLSKE
ncbi:outer membrane lipoprotein carrier protein LolA [Candidatus Poribacteria bacterium]|nr:outer membrane lipoprotein carrier protein LolA [Candidatus Poribacteria bacterium]